MGWCDLREVMGSSIKDGGARWWHWRWQAVAEAWVNRGDNVPSAVFGKQHAHKHDDVEGSPVGQTT